MNEAIEFLNNEIKIEHGFQTGPDATGFSMEPLLAEMLLRLTENDVPTVEEFRTWSWALYKVTEGPMGYGDHDTVSEITDTLAAMIYDEETQDEFFETYYD